MIFRFIQSIIEIDTKAYHFVHDAIKNSFLDKWMPIVTDINNWKWLLIIGWLALFILGGKKGRLVCIIIIVTILLADNLTSYIIKPFFGRIRPNVLLEITTEGGQSRSYSLSFPSNHAANIFALAMVLSWYYRKLFLLWFTIAVIVGFSRVYVGVHYPLDVVAGALVGITCAICVILITNRVQQWFTKRTGYLIK